MDKIYYLVFSIVALGIFWLGAVSLYDLNYEAKVHESDAATTRVSHNVLSCTFQGKCARYGGK